MKITEEQIKNQINKSFQKGFVMIKDQRNNKIALKNGVFIVNDLEQPKSKDSITFILLEAFKLSRLIQLEDITYVRKGIHWTEKV